MTMILSMVTISTDPENRMAVLDILLSVKGPTLAEQGCLACCIYEEYDEVHVITYLEKWQSAAEMYRHIRSPLYIRVLKAMELSSSKPEIVFNEVAGTRGMELIESLRISLVQ